MDLKEESSLSGSVSSDQIQSVNATNGVNSVNVVDSNEDSTSLIVVSDDEKEGFKETILDENSVVGFVDKTELRSNLEPNLNDVVKDEDDLVGETASRVVTGDELKSGDVVGNGVRVSTEEEDDDDDDDDEDVLLVGGDDDSIPVVVDTPDVELVDANIAKVSSEGDSIVETTDVDLSPQPVVTKIDDEMRDSDSVSGNDDVKYTSGGSIVVVATKMDDETRDSISVGGNDDVKVTSEGDSVVQAINVDLPLPGVAVVVKTEETGGGDVEAMEKSGLSEKIDLVLEQVVDKEVVGVTDGKFSPLGVEVEDVEKEVDSAGQENGPVAVKTGLEGDAVPDDADNGQENGPADNFVLEQSAEKDDADEEDMEELEGVGGLNTGGENSRDPQSQIVDGQIVTDSDEEDNEEDAKGLFDSAALAALLKAAADGSSESGNITFTSQDGSRLFTVKQPAGLGPSLQAMRAAPRPQWANIFNPLGPVTVENDPNLSDEERKKLEKFQSIRVKFLRLVHRLGLTPDEPVAAQVLYRLALIAGRQTGQSFSLDAAKRKAIELESDGNDDLDFALNILVMGKAGAGKSATINSIFGEEKTVVGAFQPSTSSVKEIRGTVGGVAFRVFDTPGLRASI